MLFQDKKDYHYHFSSEEKKHARSYMLNDNQFTVYFYNKLSFLKRPSGCQMKEKSCLKASAWLDLAEVIQTLSPCTFKGKINELFLVNLIDLEKIHLIVSRKRFFFDLNFKNDKL